MIDGESMVPDSARWQAGVMVGLPDLADGPTQTGGEWA
jgi:hypothetical protein